MYDTDELIDKIRELEEKTSEVWLLMGSGTNSCGDPITQIISITDFIPDIDDIKERMKRLFQDEYESWADNYFYYNACEDEDCDGEDCKPPSFDEYLKTSINISVSEWAVKHYEMMVESGGSYTFIGTANCDDEEIYYEVYLQKKTIESN